MLIGILCALGAGIMWGLVFIVPLLLGDYPGVVLSLGRYIAFGLIALVPARMDRKRVAALTRGDWWNALKLSFVGNLLYYSLLSSAIQKADAPLPTMVIGTLPVAIALFSNWLPGSHGQPIAWRRLAPPLLLIFAGLLLVNGSELAHLERSARSRSLADYAFGCALAGIAVLAWTWYPIMNARYLKDHPQITPMTWSTAQGLATLPLALAGFALFGVYSSATGSSYAFPLGPQPQLFVGLMLLVGLTASWLGTVLWNQASRRLPTSLAGQLMVFETLFALLYAFILRGAPPAGAVLGGVVLLCAGVLLGVRAFRHQVR